MRNSRIEIPVDPLASAKAAGLRYVTGEGPGIHRKRAGKGFVYIGPDGKPVRDRETLERIKSLVIPPAWEDVWICPAANGHLQATGRDAKGRKQHRYHPSYRAVRDEVKYTRMIAFGQALPLIRRRVREHLALPGLPREKVLATVVRLLETTLIRVGNDEYAKQNESYGLTTMLDGHAKVNGGTLRFRFKGKSGKFHDLEVKDPRIAKIVRRSQELPGEQLFQYLDDDGQVRDIGSGDVNDYLREITGQDFTAKDFRTWNGTVLAAISLGSCEPAGNDSTLKKNIVKVVKEVSEKLGNRPATCRKYYLHPAVLDCYTAGELLEQLKPSTSLNLVDGLTPTEGCVLNILRRQLEQAKPALALRPAS
ncbi:MAG TPA: DNA topoisomerase IB [Bryobacteraceae bacterium]|nr:DNA topoisomerase IB [Bryobacteraceae bacterium]